MSHSETYLRKLREFEGLIRFAARRYQVPGVLDPEDLYQEGCMILDKMFREYDFEPDSSDFRKMFKTELWHGLWHNLQAVKTKKRDHTKLARGDISDLEEENKEDFEQQFPTPEEYCLHCDSESVADRFLEVLADRLDDDARVVLNELIHPRSWDDIPEENRTTAHGDKYWRSPKSVPRHVIADLIGMPLISMRRAVKRIQREAEIAGKLVGIAYLDDYIAASKTKQQRRRKSHASA